MAKYKLKDFVLDSFTTEQRIEIALSILIACIGILVLLKLWTLQ